MNTHFCKVGKIRPNLNKRVIRKELETRKGNFVNNNSEMDGSKDLHGSFKIA